MNMSVFFRMFVFIKKLFVMKKLLFLVLISLSVYVFGQTTSIPDENFEHYLELHGMGNGVQNDHLVLTSNISSVISLDVSNKNIADLTGIEDFTSLSSLSCQQNKLVALDLHNNTQLINLDCSGNYNYSLHSGLNSLILPSSLYILKCNQNSLTSIDVSQCSSLYLFYCDRNNLTSLDVSNNTQLKDFRCSENNLTSLDISSNTLLETVVCSENNLTNINLLYNTALKFLTIDDNNLSQIDVSHNTTLETLNIDRNNLTTLDISTLTQLNMLICSRNNLTSLDFTNNTLLTYISCTNNHLTSLDVSNLAGLEIVFLANNELNYLDFSSNQQLRRVNVPNNDLTMIIFPSSNSQISDISIDHNNLLDLDVSALPLLEVLYCEYNELTSLNMANGNNVNLRHFATKYNPNLTCIQVDDVSFMEQNWLHYKDNQAQYSTGCAIPRIYIADTNLEAFLENHNASGNTVSLGNINSMGNGITNDHYIYASRVNGISSIDISNQNIVDLSGLESFKSLKKIDCSNNQLTAVSVLSNRTANTPYTIVPFESLQELNCSNNQIASLNLSAIQNLSYLDCHNNQLNTLNVANGNNSNFTYFDAKNNQNLSCINVDNVNYSNTNWSNGKDASANFSTNCVATITKVSKTNEFNIFPNPARNMITITSLKTDVVFSIFDNQGRKVMVGILQKGDNTLALSNLSKGFYTIMLQEDNNVYMTKLILE